MCTAKMVFFLCYLWQTSVTGRNLIAILSLRNYHRELAAVLLVKVKQGNKQFDTATNKECYIYMYVGGELESDGIPSPPIFYMYSFMVGMTKGLAGTGWSDIQTGNLS